MASAPPLLQLPPTPPIQDQAVAQYLAQVSVALQQWATQVVSSLNQVQAGNFVVAFSNAATAALTVVDKDGNGVFVTGDGSIFGNVQQPAAS